MEYSGTEVGNFGTVGGGSCETHTLNQYIFLSTQYIPYTQWVSTCRAVTVHNLNVHVMCTHLPPVDCSSSNQNFK